MGTTISGSTFDRSFARKLMKTGAADIFKCYQCGTCSAVCPMGDHMDIAPRRLIHMCRLRLVDRVAASNTAWICAACSECLVRCPNGVHIPRVMEAIRLLSRSKNIDYVDPSRIDPEVLARHPQIALVACFREHTA